MVSQQFSFSGLKYFSGIILLIISILFPLHKIESSGIALINNYKSKIVSLALHNLVNRSGDIIKSEIDEVQQIMLNSKNLLNELVQQSYDLNEEINNIFNDTLLNFELADSINNYFTKKLLQNEQRIDSINNEFIIQSDSLINKIYDYGNISYQIETGKADFFEYRTLIIFNFIQIFVYFTLMIFGIKYSRKLIDGK